MDVGAGSGGASLIGAPPPALGASPMFILPTITATLSRLSSRPKLRRGLRALVGPGLRRQPGLKRWRTYDAAANGSNGANGHGGAQVRSLSIAQIADQIVRELSDCHVICVGPVVTGDAMRTPPFYCAVASHDGEAFFTLVVGGADLSDALRTRVAIKDRLRALGRCVLSFKSESEMAVEIEKIWPSTRTTEIRQLVESGR
jgi:hypothetical protein